MKHRENIKNGESLSILGFGCMRFPKKGNEIDEIESEKMIIKAIESGVNYFDTAYIYQSGKSEGVLGKILAKGYREKVNVATKLPLFLAKKQSDFDRLFHIQLQRLQTTYIDYYLMHMLMDIATWERLKKIGVEDWIKAKKESGEIRNLGFSFHGTQAEFIRLVDAYDWDFVQIQYNFLDENNQAGIVGLKHAHQKGIPVIVMEPLRGGKIVFGLPTEVTRNFADLMPSRSVADWSLRWVWNHPEVTLVLSGMSAMAQVEENIRVASDAQANQLNETQLAVFAKAREILLERTKVPCTGCGYCMPCPYGVDIPACFAAYNDKYLNKSSFGAKFVYIRNTGALSVRPANASLCQRCRRCEEHCPQRIVISERMKEVASVMEGPLFKPMVYIMRKGMKMK